MGSSNGAESQSRQYYSHQNFAQLVFGSVLLCVWESLRITETQQMSVARRGVTELQKSSWLSVHFLKSKWQSSFLRHRARRLGVQGLKQPPQHSPPPTNNTTTTTNINTHQQNNSSRRRSVGYVARQRQPRRSGHPCRHLLRPISSSIT